MPPPPLASSAPRTIGPYLVLEELGRGGMGAVYRARHGQTGAEHAVKVTFTTLDSESARRRFARFRREMEVLARIAPHPGIVRIHACGEDRGRPWCAMELVAGEPLGRRLERTGPLPPEEAARVVAAVARAVEHVHAHDVVHRDLKPENVILDSRAGVPRVVDFGLAYDAFSEELTKTGELLGTPAYMAPEQVARGGSAAGSGERSAEIGPPTDVYGLGAVLYATLTGHAPFEGGSFLEIVNALVNAAPVDPRRRQPEVPRELEAVCLRAIEKERTRRYPTAAALADDLERWLRGEPTVAQPIGPIGRLFRRGLPTEARRRRRRVLAIAGVLGVAALLGGVAWLLAARSAAARARQAALAEDRRDLDAAFEAACGGDLDALARARALLDRVVGEAAATGEGRDAVLATRREVIGLLEKLAAGDEVRVRAIDLQAQPWSAHRQAIVRVLLASGRTRGLAIVLEREPALAEEAAAPMAAALADGAVEPSPRLVDRVVGALERRAEPLPAADERLVQNADLRARILVRRLEAVLTDDGDAAAAALSPLLHDLLAALGDGARSPTLPPAAVERLVARVSTQASDLEVADLRSLGLLVQAALELLPADDRRARRVVDGLQRDLTLSIVGAGAMTKAHAFEVAIILYRVNRLPFRVQDIDPVAPSSDELEERVAEIIARGTPRVELAELIIALEILVRRREHETRQGLELHVEREVKAAALLERWSIVTAILEREWRRRDVPGAILAQIAHHLERIDLVGVDELPRPRRLEVHQRLEELAPEGHLGPPGDDLSARFTPLIDRLYEDAIARDAHLPLDRRPIKPLLAYVEWLVDGSARPNDRAVELVLEALGRAPSIAAGELVAGRSPQAARLEALVLVSVRLVDGLVRERDPGSERCALAATVDEVARAVEEARPDLPDAHRLRAAHLARHDVDEALAELDRGVAHAFDSVRGRMAAWRPFLDAARLLIERERFDEARAWLAGDPGPGFRHHYHYQERADFWATLGETERAEADYARSRQLSGG